MVLYAPQLSHEEVRDETYRVSIIIPCHNARPWIGDCVRSCLGQTYQSIEIIIVDDGSTDSSSALATEILEGKSVKWQIIRTTNAGPSRARNIGWQSACGDWIQFLDADDLLDAEKVARQMAVATQIPHEFASVYSDWQHLYFEDGRWYSPYPPRTPHIDQDTVTTLLQDEGFTHIGAQLFRRTWLEVVGGFDEQLWLIEDVHMMLRLAMAGGLFRRVESDRPLFYYRRHSGGSLSQRDPIEFAEGCIRNAELAQRYWESRNELTEERKQVIASVYFQSARTLYGYDRYRFHEVLEKLDVVAPKYLPTSPSHLRLAVKYLGHVRAEAVATTWRRLRGRN